jgi:hypothetical protein
VVIDQRDQAATTGELWFFRDCPQYAATLCATDQAYPDRLLKRFLVLTDDLLVDVLAVTGTTPGRLDWVTHCRGTPAVSPALAARAKPLGDGNGYQHLTALAEGLAEAARTFAFDQGGRVLRVHPADDAGTTLVTGLGIGYRLNDPVPFLMRRRQAAATSFITVYDFRPAGSAVQRVERLPATLDGKPLADTDAIGLRIAGGAATVVVGLDLRRQATGRPTVAGHGFERVMVRAP